MLLCIYLAKIEVFLLSVVSLLSLKRESGIPLIAETLSAEVSRLLLGRITDVLHQTITYEVLLNSDSDTVYREFYVGHFAKKEKVGPNSC